MSSHLTAKNRNVIRTRRRFFASLRSHLASADATMVTPLGTGPKHGMRVFPLGLLWMVLKQFFSMSELKRIILLMISYHVTQMCRKSDARVTPKWCPSDAPGMPEWRDLSFTQFTHVYTGPPAVASLVITFSSRWDLKWLYTANVYLGKLSVIGNYIFQLWKNYSKYKTSHS